MPVKDHDHSGNHKNEKNECKNFIVSVANKKSSGLSKRRKEQLACSHINKIPSLKL